jgi:hypothetical protein
MSTSIAAALNLLNIRNGTFQEWSYQEAKNTWQLTQIYEVLVRVQFLSEGGLAENDDRIYRIQYPLGDSQEDNGVRLVFGAEGHLIFTEFQKRLFNRDEAKTLSLIHRGYNPLDESMIILRLRLLDDFDKPDVYKLPVGYELSPGQLPA